MSSRPTEAITLALRRLCCLATVTATAACTTTLTGSKAGTTTEGLVYYLPAPHLYLSPQADGSIALEVKYLPDPTNAYALKLDSYLTKATFEVVTSNGLLTTVSLDADATEVAASTLAAATEIRKTRIAAAQTKEAARKTQEEAKRTAIKTAVEAVSSQREKVQLLEAKQKFYEDNPPKEGSDFDPVGLKLEVSQERLKLTQLEARLGLIQDSPTSAFNDPGANMASKENQAYGPALFRILRDGEGVKLVAVGDQITMATAKPIAVSSSIEITPAKIVIRKADAQRNAVIDFSTQVRLVPGSAKVMNPALGATAPAVMSNDKLGVSLAPSGKRLTIQFPPILAPGRYRVDFDVIGPSDKRQLVSVPIEWLLD